MYKKIIRPILFKFSPERIHVFTLWLLGVMAKVPYFRRIVRMIFRKDYPDLHRNVFGIDFPNPVGLAGGMDKNGERYNEMSDFGFGFVEIGSLTPRPQDGNPKPRVFRVPQDQAIVNRMGINNKGVINAISHLKSSHPEVIVAANIAKNSTSEDEIIVRDYETAFSLLYDFVDMFVLNFSCPNVEGLTSLQDVSFLSDIVDKLIEDRISMEVYKPILLKVSPDLPPDGVGKIVDYALASGIDGIVCGNTTKSRDGLTISNQEIGDLGAGGMSGLPLYKKNLALVKLVAEKSRGRLPIVGVGGIMTPEQAKEMLDAGASLIEVFSGFVFNGPGFVKDILKHLHQANKASEIPVAAPTEDAGVQV